MPQTARTLGPAEITILLSELMNCKVVAIEFIILLSYYLVLKRVLIFTGVEAASLYADP
jgi:hypothetical protein